VECANFFFPTASIAGAQGLSFLQLLSISNPLVASITFLLNPLTAGISAGTVPASNTNPTGTIVPTSTIPIFAAKKSPVIYDAPSNSFIVRKKGLYEITYSIQGAFQHVCPTGVQFAIFVNDNIIKASSQRAATAIGTQNRGQGFIISKTFCLFFEQDAKWEDCNKTNDISSSNIIFSSKSACKNAIQLRAVVNDVASLTCISLITNSIRTREDPVGFSFEPAGTLVPNNAFEITFKHISDTL
jgi:hypothetical protein